jgi:2-dehydro-3-deoxygluconokinase
MGDALVPARAAVDQDADGERGNCRGILTAMKHHSAVTLGESLGLVRTAEFGPLRPGGDARISFAGAESNVAVGLARLGHPVSYVSRVGSDAVGRMVTTTLRGENVDVGHVAVDPQFPTALMLREHRTSSLLRVMYFRRGSACARLTREDIPVDMITAAGLLHISGITFGLSDTAREAATYAVSIAQEAGVLVSLDVNYRNALWSRPEASSVLRSVVGQVDIAFGGDDELALLCEESPRDLDAMAEVIMTDGPATVVCKQGAAGATAWDASGRHVALAVPTTEVDPVGAGDAFVAGYLSATLDGESVDTCLQRATRCGAFCVAVPGDWEGLPLREELEMLSLRETVRR